MVLLMPGDVGRLQLRPGFDLDWRRPSTDLLTYVDRPVTDDAATCHVRILTPFMKPHGILQQGYPLLFRFCCGFMPDLFIT